jgi:hypothetical protein
LLLLRGSLNRIRIIVLGSLSNCIWRSKGLICFCLYLSLGVLWTRTSLKTL